MNTSNETASATSVVLNGLIETCKDGQEGFRHAADDTTNPQLKLLFQRLSDQRENFATQLQAVVRSTGDHAETTSSVTGALHRGWIDLKAAITSKDERAVLAECERGEDSAVAQYRDALAMELPADLRSMISAQSADVQKAHDEMRSLRDHAA